MAIFQTLLFTSGSLHVYERKYTETNSTQFFWADKYSEEWSGPFWQLSDAMEHYADTEKKRKLLAANPPKIADVILVDFVNKRRINA